MTSEMICGSPIAATLYLGTRGTGSSNKTDMSYTQAKDAILRDGIPSVAFLHRELGCGYKQAAVYLERMERDGVVSPILNGQRFVVSKIKE